MPHGTVWLVGDMPHWARGVRKIQHDRVGDDRFAFVRFHLLALLEHPDCPPRFAVWNDDFFRMTPMAGYRAEHRGPARDFARRKMAEQPSPYHRSIAGTADLLAERGIDDPLCYEMHAPIVVEAHLLRLVLDRWAGLPQWQWRTAYGNIARLGGARMADPKLHDDKPPPPDWDWLSTSPTSWRGGTGGLIRATFTEPSPYERPTTRQARA